MNHLFPFLLAFLLSAIVTPLLARSLVEKKISLQVPRKRDIHTYPIPRLGGVAIAIVFWLSILAITLTNPSALHFVDEKILGIDRNLFGVLLGSLILVIAGAVDDIWGMKPLPKLAIQAVAAAMLPLFGVKVQWLANPLGGLAIELTPWLDALLAVAWIVLVINVLNFLDGLDGLATGVSSIVLISLYLLALAPFVAQPALALLLIVLLGAALGFLPFNWHPAKIFLGDSGSQFLGYLLGVAAIISGGKLATAALVLSVPILDALWTIIRRIGQGRSPFDADQEHLHHRLLATGLSQPVVAILFMVIAAIFGMIALSSRTAGKVEALVGSAIFMVILLVGLTLFMKTQKAKRGAHETK